MSKLIVTHHRPDLDALTSLWLLKRFLFGWEEAKVQFVSAGETFRGAPPDDDPEVIHVDTGMGRFDHHQKKSFSSSTKLVLGEIFKTRDLKKVDKKALKRLVGQVTEIDNGRDISWPEAESDRYAFMLHNFLTVAPGEEEVLSLALLSLDKVFQFLKNEVRAEEVLKKEGQVFKTKWGEAIAVRTGSDQVITAGEKQGYSLVVKQDPRSGHLRVFGRWDRKIDLRKAFGQLKKADPEATWYLHPSRCLLLNGSRNNPKMKPTRLPLEEIVKILEIC